MGLIQFILADHDQRNVSLALSKTRLLLFLSATGPALMAKDIILSRDLHESAFFLEDFSSFLQLDTLLPSTSGSARWLDPQ